MTKPTTESRIKELAIELLIWKLQASKSDKRIKELETKLEAITEWFPVCGEVHCTDVYNKLQAAESSDE